MRQLIDLLKQQSNSLQQLALVTKIRQLLGSDVVLFNSLCENTEVLQLCASILAFRSNHSRELRCMRLEAYWILINLAMGDRGDLIAERVAGEIELELQTLMQSNFQDLDLYQSVLWLASNLMYNDPEFTAFLSNKTSLIASWEQVFQTRSILP